MTLTLAYCTARINPRLDWFLDSIFHQDTSRIREILVIDAHCKQREEMVLNHPTSYRIQRHLPKPTVWQGEHRLTSVDFFDQASCRNTAICLAKGTHICFVDDLALAAPTFMQAIYKSMDEGWISCGAFRKVNKLQVHDGKLMSFENDPTGCDPRWKQWKYDDTKSCPSEWSFGCSIAGPLEAFLSTNGYPEDLTAGMGYEDSVFGQTVARNGYELRYNRKQLTYESQEDHHNQPVMLRFDPGISPNDKSHAMLEKCKGVKRFENDFGDGITDIRVLREHIQSGGSFPIRTAPTHEWFSGWPLKDFHNYKPE